jgi:periplasmic protein TonB
LLIKSIILKMNANSSHLLQKFSVNSSTYNPIIFEGRSLLCSLRPRNLLLISAVSISHFLVLLCLLFGTAIGAGEPTLGVLSINLTNAGNDLSSQSKYPIQANSHAPSSTAISSATQSANVPGVVGEEGAHSAEITSRNIVHGPKPHYPLVSRHLKEQGLVVIKLCINQQGTVDDVGLVKSSGFQHLDRSALRTLAEWRFTPIPSVVASSTLRCYHTPIQFTLES